MARPGAKQSFSFARNIELRGRRKKESKSLIVHVKGGNWKHHTEPAILYTHLLQGVLFSPQIKFSGSEFQKNWPSSVNLFRNQSI